MKTESVLKAMEQLDRETFFLKSEWLELAVLCLERSEMIQDSASLDISRKSLQFAMDYQRELEREARKLLERRS